MFQTFWSTFCKDDFYLLEWDVSLMTSFSSQQNASAYASLGIYIPIDLGSGFSLLLPIGKF